MTLANALDGFNRIIDIEIELEGFLFTIEQYYIYLILAIFLILLIGGILGD